MAQGRRVRRVLRKIDSWSVLKVAFLFNVSLALVFVVAGVLLWTAGSRLGAIEAVEKFIAGITVSSDFTFAGRQLFRGFAAAAAIFVVAGTGSAVLVSVIYNLISDMVGGIQYTVLEEAARPRLVTATDVPKTVEPAEERSLASGYPA